MAKKGCLNTPGLMPKHEVKILMVPHDPKQLTDQKGKPPQISK